MSNWVQRIADLFTNKPDVKLSEPLAPVADFKRHSPTISHDFSKQFQPMGQDCDEIVAFTQDLSSSMPYNTRTRAQAVKGALKTNAPLEDKHEVKKVVAKEDDNDNVKALKKLREMPRGLGSNVDSRIAAIKSMLGEKEIFKTLQMLRWPKGIVCPKCKSSKVVRRDPPPDAPDKRHYYECLNCKGKGNPSDFDDFTGLPVGSLHGLRQWIFCWYLIGFCSLSQISKIMGLGLAEVSKMIEMSSHLTELAEGTEMRKELEAKDFQRKERKRSFFENRKESIMKQEDDTRSESKNIHKPGPKSKK